MNAEPLDPSPPPPEWLAALDRSDADLAAGRTVPWHEVRTRLLDRIAGPAAKTTLRQA